jgi:hypothetical protein
MPADSLRNEGKYFANIYVDMRNLDWDRVNADEDPHFDGAKHDWSGYQWPKPIPFAYNKNNTIDGEKYHVEDEDGNYYRHWGEWADHHKLNEPHHVAHSLNRSGTVAVEGGIDPTAFVPAEEVERYMRENHGERFVPNSFGGEKINAHEKVPYEMPVTAKVARPVDDTYWWEETSPDMEGFRDFEPGKWEDLYHGTSPARAQLIMEQGLKPWDHPDVGGHQWHSDWLSPRPNHVYMTTNRERAWLLANEDNQGDRKILHIDPAYLHPQNINPDEDAGHHFLPSAPRGMQTEDTEWKSLGEWAEKTGWGDDPEQTAQVLDSDFEHSNGIAHRGMVPPEAIRGAYSKGFDGWHFEKNPKYQPFPQVHAKVGIPDWQQIGNVDAILHVDDDNRTVNILEWRSRTPGQGNTTESLNELRQRYPGYRIEAPDSYSTPGASEYWDHMQTKGLIDSHGLREDTWQLA